jgi:hypothetical protein
MPITSALVLSGELPATPLIVLSGDTIAKVASLTADAAALAKLTTPAEANAAAQLLRQISGLNKDIDKARLEVARPFLDFQRRINDAAKAPTAQLDAAERTVRAALTAYQIEQERIQREEAERQRKEQARLEAEARRLQEQRAKAEADRLAAEKAAAAAPADDDDGFGDLAAEVEQEDMAAQQAAIAVKATQLAQTRAVVAPKPEGIHYRTTLKHAVTDVHRLPSNLVIITPNDAEIRRLFVTGWKEGDALPTVPGITFTVDKQPIVTGRR